MRKKLILQLASQVLTCLRKIIISPRPKKLTYIPAPLYNLNFANNIKDLLSNNHKNSLFIIKNRFYDLNIKKSKSQYEW